MEMIGHTVLGLGDNSVSFKTLGVNAGGAESNFPRTSIKSGVAAHMCNPSAPTAKLE